MPPASSNKGTSKKNSALANNQKASRNTTPAPAPAPAPSTMPARPLPQVSHHDPDYLEARLILLDNIEYDQLVEVDSRAPVPDARSLNAMMDKLKTLTEYMEKRSTFYDRSMRFMVNARKRQGASAVDSEPKKSKHKRKKGSDTKGGLDSSPARGDAKRKTEHDSDGSSLSPAPAGAGAMDVDAKEPKPEKDAKDEDGDGESSEDEEEGAPRKKEMPQAHTFGDDPSTFPDPTVYGIRPIHPDMSEEEKKEIYAVASYPKSDLADLIAGDPPDRDFSVAKPTNQINFSTFSTYTEPYFRPFSEEDLTFLRERGDRVTPFVMPRRNKKTYQEIWAEEDGGMGVDSTGDPLAPNEARGSVENMNDAAGETNQLSLGPVESRLLQALRVQNRASADQPNGDLAMDIDGTNDDAPPGEANGAAGFTPATQMPDSSTDAWKKANHPKLTALQREERIKQELRHIGFLSVDEEPDFDAHYDDEVATRLRLLQAQLRQTMLVNGARKARVMELVKERLAQQEYQTILEDLDSQVQAAYLKRTRTMGKSKKKSRPGGAGGGSHAVGAGVARPGIGDQTKTLMDRRKRWISELSPIFEGLSNKVPRVEDGDTSIFTADRMAELMKMERKMLDEEEAEDAE